MHPMLSRVSYKNNVVGDGDDVHTLFYNAGRTPEIVRLLLSSDKTDPTDSSNGILQSYIGGGKTPNDSILLFVNDSRVDLSAGGGLYALNWAIKNGYTNVAIRLLNDSRVDPYEGINREKPLTLAIKSKNAEIIQAFDKLMD